MQTWEETIMDLELAAQECLKQMAQSSVPDTMTPGLPPVGQRLWNHCKGILTELNSEEFEKELAP